MREGRLIIGFNRLSYYGMGDLILSSYYYCTLWPSESKGRSHPVWAMRSISPSAKGKLFKNRLNQKISLIYKTNIILLFSEC